MKRKIYLYGESINGFIIVREVESKSNDRKFRFECRHCGSEFNAFISNIRRNHTTSCGCKKAELISEGNTKHSKTNHSLYFVWHDMKDRCYNANYVHRHRYGGRGITVCDEWVNDFVAFYDWSIDNGWSKGLQIDRENNDGNYEPNNCRFVTSIVNVRNSSILKMNEYSVRTLKRMIRRFPEKSDAELSKNFGISRTTVYDIRTGKTWSDIKI